MEQTQAVTKKKFYKSKWFWILAISIFIGIMASNSNDSPSSVSTNTQQVAREKDYVQSVGENGYLRNGLDNVLVSASREALSAITKASIAHDDVGIEQVVASGQAFFVKAGTKVLIIDSPSMGVKEIRITDGTLAGKNGFVPMEFVKKQ